MTKTEFLLRSDYIELCSLLKLLGLANTGGHGKILVANGEVRVNGTVELRKTAKIRVGQVVSLAGVEITVRAGEPV